METTELIFLADLIILQMGTGTDGISIFYGDPVTGIYKGDGGRFLGGEDTDIMSVENGNIFRINGNNGNDLIIGNSGRYFLIMELIKGHLVSLDVVLEMIFLL